MARSAATKKSSLAFHDEELDCFATLAMTSTAAVTISASALAAPPLPRHTRFNLATNEG
jgi:hypothetical protein